MNQICRAAKSAQVSRIAYHRILNMFSKYLKAIAPPCLLIWLEFSCFWFSTLMAGKEKKNWLLRG